MKKFLLMVLFAIVAVSAGAQKKYTIWWGGNIADITGDISPKSEFKALNIGFTYTDAIDDKFDWSAGAGYLTKGYENWSPGFLQFEGNGVWNFMKGSDSKIGLFTGPYLGFMLNDDDIGGANTVDFGWQGGLTGNYKFLAVKIGYEYGFCNLLEELDSKPGEFFFRIGLTF